MTLINKIINWLRNIDKPVPVEEKRKNVPTYFIDKHYDEMNRKEKREYKKWLRKNKLWDGAEGIAG